jgi:hypothetical protein
MPETHPCSYAPWLLPPMRRARHPIRSGVCPMRRRSGPEALAEAPVRPSKTVDSAARELAARHQRATRGAGPGLVVAGRSCSTRSRPRIGRPARARTCGHKAAVTKSPLRTVSASADHRLPGALIGVPALSGDLLGSSRVDCPLGHRPRAGGARAEKIAFPCVRAVVPCICGTSVQWVRRSSVGERRGRTRSHPGRTSDIELAGSNCRASSGRDWLAAGSSSSWIR